MDNLTGCILLLKLAVLFVSLAVIGETFLTWLKL